MGVDQGIDRFTMGPEQASPFVNVGSLISKSLGGQFNVSPVNSTSVVRVWKSELIMPEQLSLPFNFGIDILGSIGSNSAGDDLDVQLVAVSGGLDTDSEDPDAEVDIFDANPLFNLAQETGDVCWIKVFGSIALEQVTTTSAKIRAMIVGRALQGTPVDGQALSAAAGVAKDVRGGLHLALDFAFATDGGANSVYQPYSILAFANNRAAAPGS
jgi:hypothetical protein